VTWSEGGEKGVRSGLLGVWFGLIPEVERSLAFGYCVVAFPRRDEVVVGEEFLVRSLFFCFA
jgi:hypothetical protein